MATTLRELLTPEEQQRFKYLYTLGFFTDEITFNLFVEGLRCEFDSIDLLQQQLDCATTAIERVTGSAAQDVYCRSVLQDTIDAVNTWIRERRTAAFESAFLCAYPIPKYEEVDKC